MRCQLVIPMCVLIEKIHLRTNNMIKDYFALTYHLELICIPRRNVRPNYS